MEHVHHVHSIESQTHNGVRETQTQAEMIAMSTAMFSEAFSVQTMLEHLLQRSVRVNNLGVVQISKSGYSAKLRHAPRVHRVNISSVHEISGEFAHTIEYTQTEEQIANGLIKVIAPID